MALASSSRTQIRYIEELVFGEVPAVGNPRDLRMVGETLDFAFTKQRSEEINASRAVSSVVPVSASTSGGVNCEMQYAELDELMAATLQSDFAVYGTGGVGTTFTADFAANTITASVAPTGNSAFTTLKKGQFFKVNATGANGGKLYRVSKTTAPTSTVITLDPNTPATVAAGVAGVSLSTSRLTNGVDQRSYTIERDQSDIGVFMAYTGQTASKLTLNIATGSLSTMNFEFMGRAALVDDTAGGGTALPGTPIPSFPYDVHSSQQGNLCQMWEGGVPMDAYIRSLTLDYDNALRSQEAICSLGAVGIGSGTIVATVTASIYFADKTLYEKYLNNDYSEVCFTSLDPVGNGYVFVLPRCNISTARTNASAKDQDMMLDITWEVLRDAGNPDTALRQVVFIDRVGAAIA